jgi:hypothetical protein
MDFTQETLHHLGSVWVSVVEKWIAVEIKLSENQAATKRARKTKKGLVSALPQLFKLPPLALRWMEQFCGGKLSSANAGKLKTAKFCNEFHRGWKDCHKSILEEQKTTGGGFVWAFDNPNQLATFIHCFTCWALVILERDTRAEAKEWDNCVGQFGGILDTIVASSSL